MTQVWVFHHAKRRGDLYKTEILVNEGLNGLVAFTANGYDVGQFTAYGLYLSPEVIRYIIKICQFSLTANFGRFTGNGCFGSYISSS